MMVKVVCGFGGSRSLRFGLKKPLGRAACLGAWDVAQGSGGGGLMLEAGFAFNLAFRLQPVVYVLPVFSGA